MFAELFMVGSSLLSAYSSYKSGKQEAKSSMYNSAMALQNARTEREFANAEMLRLRREAEQLRGKNRAAAGASGTDVTTGSFVDALRDDAVEAELDALLVQAKGEARAQDFTFNAGLYQTQAKRQRSQGTEQAALSLLKGGVALSERWG